jgi:AraC family transcriptional regulator
MVAPHIFGGSKFPEADLLRSSGRNWNGIAAEVRAHPAGEIAPVSPTHMEVTLAVSGASSAIVERRADGRIQRTSARAGTLWFCPIGVQEDSIRITKPLPEILHLYIPDGQFDLLGESRSRPVKPSDVFYLAGIDDELIRQIGYRLLRELKHETSVGRLLVEQLSLSLISHIVSTYSPDAAPADTHRVGTALDQRRLRRVIDYIEQNFERDLSLADLAEVACLSRHHFARAFREATGTPPHRYISIRRLEHACRLLAEPDVSLAEVAFACSFSSQTNFTRAFRRHVGLSPGAYRRRANL